MEEGLGLINSESYCAHTVLVPIIHRYLELCHQDGVYLKLMQDGASRHAAGDTASEFYERGIHVIHWPPFSPNLNPIQQVWHFIKNYLQDNFPEHVTYNTAFSG